MKYHDIYTVKRCVICGLFAETHEIVTRGSGGKCEPWNQLDLCRAHHREFHDNGRYSFALAHPGLYDKIKEACERAGRVFNKEGK